MAHRLCSPHVHHRNQAVIQVAPRSRSTHSCIESICHQNHCLSVGRPTSLDLAHVAAVPVAEHVSPKKHRLLCLRSGIDGSSIIHPATFPISSATVSVTRSSCICSSKKPCPSARHFSLGCPILHESEHSPHHDYLPRFTIFTVSVSHASFSPRFPHSFLRP